MNFVMDKDIPSKIRTDVILSDRDTGKLFNSKFRQIFIELPNFNKEEDECENDFERWIYILKHKNGKFTTIILIRWTLQNKKVYKKVYEKQPVN